MHDPIRVAIDTIPGLVWSALPDGFIDFLNLRWLEFTGMSLEQARGWGWQDAVHPDDRASLLDFWKQLLVAERSGETEARLRRHDGSHRWFIFRGVPMRDDSGRVIKWYGQTTDIDDRKRAEALLSGEKWLLEMVASDYPLGDTLDALCRLVESNQPHSQCAIVLVGDRNRLEHGAAPTLPKEFCQAIHGRPVNMESGPCAAAACSKQQVISADTAMDFRWDAYGWRELAVLHGLRSCWSTPIVSKSGEALGTFAMYSRSPASPGKDDRDLIEQFTDLASIAIERSRRERELQRSRAQLAEAQRLSQTGSFSWRASTGEMDWSAQTYRIFGLDPSATPNIELVRARIHPGDRDLVAATIDRSVSEGSDFGFEHRLLTPDGAVKHVQVVAHAMRDIEGNFMEFVGAVHDVSERRASDEALHRMRSQLAHVARVATLGELTASIAHEVNQPLLGIVTNASTSLRMLAHEPPNIVGAREAARRTIRDANRASDVIARLRALFRKTSGPLELLDLNEATREVIALARIEMQRHGVVLRMDFESGLPQVYGDRVQIQQVILNLVVNATEAMVNVNGRPREIRVSTMRYADDLVRLEVRDTGIGLDPQMVERVFDPFHSSKNDGMGMGLSISRTIIEHHQGRLSGAPNEGCGATFHFTMPRAAVIAPTTAHMAVTVAVEGVGG